MNKCFEEDGDRDKYGDRDGPAYRDGDSYGDKYGHKNGEPDAATGRDADAERGMDESRNVYKDTGIDGVEYGGRE